MLLSSRSLLSKLKGMSTDNTPEEYGPLIESMCKWQKSRDLLELISDWFEASIVVKDPNESGKKVNSILFMCRKTPIFLFHHTLLSQMN